MEILKFFGISWGMFKRTFLRSLALFALIAIANVLLVYFVDAARLHGSEWPDRFPQIIIVFSALSILTWFDLSILWLRLATEPSLDMQEAARKAMQTPASAASIYRTRVFMWAVRLAVLVTLCGFWQ